MRRLMFVVVGIILLLLVIVVVVFGLKSPEMPIQEVHKIISTSKFEKQPIATPALPEVPPMGISAQGNVQQPATNPQSPKQAATPPIIIPYQGNNIQPTPNPQTLQQNMPAVPQSGALPGNALH